MNDYHPSATQLPTLPEFEPAPDLWSRIERRHVRRQRQRRLVAACGMAAVVVAAVAVFSFHFPTPEIDALSEQRRETFRLEQDWRALGAETADSGYARLWPVDVALQRAYDRRADGSELDRLWSERNQMLRDLIQSRRDATATPPNYESLISI